MRLCALLDGGDGVPEMKEPLGSGSVFHRLHVSLHPFYYATPVIASVLGKQVPCPHYREQLILPVGQLKL